MTTCRYKQVHLILVALTTSLLGMSILLMGHHSHIQITTDFYGISDILAPVLFNTIAGVAFVISAILALCSLKNASLQKWLATLLIIISVTPILSLFSAQMWIDSLGGFPAIGSGQGVIKYFALLSIGLMLLPNQLRHSQRKWLAVFPAALYHFH